MVMLECKSDRVVFVGGTIDPSTSKETATMADKDWSKEDEKAMNLEAKALLIEQEALWKYNGGHIPPEVREKINAAWAAYEASL